MQIRDYLCINSYGGSLLAALIQEDITNKNANLVVRGSYESNGYGIDVQRYNAPLVHYVENTNEWPTQDLSTTCVIGAPEYDDADVDPYTAVSRFIRYAMENDSPLVMMEVPPRAEAAMSLFTSYAEEFHMGLFRVMVSADLFGVPQTQKRMWLVFVRDTTTVHVGFKRKRVPSFNELFTHEGPPLDDHLVIYNALLKTLRENIKENTEETIKELFSGKRGYGNLNRILMKDPQFFHVEIDKKNPFIVLHPRNPVKAITRPARWIYDGELFTVRDFMRFTGFPDWYRIPPRLLKNIKTLMYLSQGVCPPVAQWMLRAFAIGDGNVSEGEHMTISTGELLDLTRFVPTKDRLPRIVSTAYDGVNPDAPPVRIYAGLPAEKLTSTKPWELPIRIPTQDPLAPKPITLVTDGSGIYT